MASGGENHALDFFLDIRGCVAGRMDERLHVRWLDSRPACVGDHRAGIRVYFQTPVSYLALARGAGCLPGKDKEESVGRIKSIGKAELGPAIACLFAAALVLPS